MILRLDFECEIPIYQQIRNQIVLGAARGELAPGEPLPSVRQLAEQSGINPMTVHKAYQLLKQEGVLVIDRRSGARIAGTGASSTDAAETMLRPQLELLIGEARLRGLDCERFLTLSRRIYEEQAAASFRRPDTSANALSQTGPGPRLATEEG